MDYFVRNGELYHWGVPGMKWGVRRYQNADGSLTDAGKRRAHKQKVKNLKKARKAKEEKAERQKRAKAGKIPVSKMTDDELRARIERLRLEETVQNLTKSTSSADSVNKGKDFVKKYGSDAVKKIVWENAVDIGKQVVKHYGVDFANKKIGSDVIFTNNKKKS
jgi:hypothetical protein